MCEENESEKAILRIQHWDELVECLELTYITSTSATTETSNRNKSLEYFVHNHPLKSWWLVYRSLQRVGHIMQARYVKTKYIGELHTSHTCMQNLACTCTIMFGVVIFFSDVTKTSESDVSEGKEDDTSKSLTQEAVLQYIQRITNISDKFSQLGRHLLGYSYEFWTNEEEIVKKWMASEDASWRSLIHALDKMEETDVADELIKDARMEPVNCEHTV